MIILVWIMFFIPNHYVGIKGRENWDLRQIIWINFFYIIRNDNE